MHVFQKLENEGVFDSFDIGTTDSEPPAPAAKSRARAKPAAAPKKQNRRVLAVKASRSSKVA